MWRKYSSSKASGRVLRRSLKLWIGRFCQLSRQRCRRMRADAVGLPCRKYGEGGFRATVMKHTTAIGGNMLVVRICQSSRQGCPNWRGRAGLDKLLTG